VVVAGEDWIEAEVDVEVLDVLDGVDESCGVDCEIVDVEVVVVEEAVDSSKVVEVTLDVLGKDEDSVEESGF